MQVKSATKAPRSFVYSLSAANTAWINHTTLLFAAAKTGAFGS